MKPKFRARWILLTAIALIMGAFLYMVVAGSRAERLNATLIQAAYTGQEQQGVACLQQGADANLRFDSRTRKPFPSGFWSGLKARLRGKLSGDELQSVPLLSLTAAYSRKILLPELLARNANVDAPDGMGSTPLMYAVDHNDRDILLDLLTARADVNHANKIGNTALHLAVAQKNAVNCALLLDHGANPNLANAEGLTPLDDLAVLAAEVHREWLATYMDVLAKSGQKHPAPVTSPPGGVVLPSHPTPEMVTRQHQAQLNRLRSLVNLLQSHGAATSAQTQTLLADSFLLDPQEAHQGLAPPTHR